METWSTHHLFSEAKDTHGPEVAFELKSYAEALIGNGLPVIFSLGHLSRITGVKYSLLRASVERKRESANYRMFSIAKRSGGRRFIHGVTSELEHVQRFINSEILQKTDPHPASFAFHSLGGIRGCAARHCGARWLLQFDLKDFFYSISEFRVYEIFKEMGYRELLSFELARLCTTTRLPKSKESYLLRREGENPLLFPSLGPLEDPLPYPNLSHPMGVLPQGAPTSPMLSNLFARRLDEGLSTLAKEFGMVYTRYADDLTLSAVDIPVGVSLGSICSRVKNCIRRSGFFENPSKMRIAGPGSKKVVLGLLVDGENPRISKETFRRVDRHLHAVSKYGWEATAEHEGFDSSYGFHNHICGLIAFINDVDPARWELFSRRLSSLPVPPWKLAVK